MNIKTKFGKRVRTLRNEKGYSQEKFASVCKLHRTYMGMIERGERNITLENIEKIAVGLGIEMNELFEF